MEGSRRDFAGGGRRRGGGGGGGEESDASSGGVELSLALGTGRGSHPAAAKEEAAPATEEEAAPAARRSMTIFYNGRVCTADVTEIQARAIISMASQEILGDRQRPRGDDDRQRQQDNSESGSSSSGGHLRPAAASPAGTPRQQQGGLAVAAAPAIGHVATTGLSMKRSLQRFLQKRKARVGDAAAPPYAGGRQAQAMRH